jgi:NAD(P)-dependent dehydrogenase (short-subunit alcohol dehydrogenase family)
VERRSVVITGASTGIGRACAFRLARAGITVFAGVRKDSDGDALKREVASIRPVTMDVTDRASLEAAAEMVADAIGPRLHGLVNNAGIAVPGPIELIPLDRLREQFEVNVIGLVSSTQVFLPALRAAGGRIVNIGSIAGRAPAIPLLGPYAASKWAVEAISDALRGEVAAWDIRVSLVEPGNIKTPIWDKGDERFDHLPSEAATLYGRLIERGRALSRMFESQGVDPDKVARKVEHALTASLPRQRYLVGIDAYVRAHVEARLPHRLRDAVIRRVVRH